MDFMMYMASLKGLTKPYAKRRAKELLEMAGLGPVSRKKIRTYSGGMRQKLGMAQALLNDPRIVILDEPTTGLDPVERIHFRNLAAKLGESRIVLISTHIVSDLEHMPSTLLMMKGGQIVFRGPAAEIDDLEDFYLKVCEDSER